MNRKNAPQTAATRLARWNPGAAVVALALCTAAVVGARPAAPSQPDPAEARVLSYVRDHVRPGQPLLVTDLYNRVFTQADERRALEKLYNAFFRIPLFVAQYQKRFRRPPTLEVIAEQFDLPNADASQVLLRVMECDPRVPHFFTRDARSGEITSVDAAEIQSDPRFSKAFARQLGGWEGQPAPAFHLTGMDNNEADSSALRGKVVLLYVWFTGCPPCMQEAPNLVELERELGPRGLAIVGANADELLNLGYDDAVRRGYAQKEKINFPVVNWTRESDAAYGNISIFPTLFLIGRQGVVRGQWVGFVKREDLRNAIAKELGN